MLIVVYFLYCKFGNLISIALQVLESKDRNFARSSHIVK